jgi:hypothetical protein
LGGGDTLAREGIRARMAAVETLFLTSLKEVSASLTGESSHAKV